MKKAKYHEDYYDSDSCKGDSVLTSKRYTVSNVGCGKVKIVAADGDKIHGNDHHLYVKAGKNVTIQNYKNTWYVVA
jgi:hypothetical protein